MSDVYWRPIVEIAGVLQRRGLDPNRAFKSLPFTQHEVRALERISWDHFLIFLDNVATMTGGLTGVAEVVDSGVASFPVWNVIGRLLLSPRQLYHLANRAGLGFYKSLVLTMRDLPDGRFLQEMSILPAYAPSLAMMYAQIGALRGLSRAIGLPPAHVEATLDPRKSTFVVTFPPSQTLAARMPVRFLDLLASEFGAHRRMVDEGVAEAAIDLIDLREICASLTGHDTPESFARDAETILRTHAGCRHVVLWEQRPDGREELLLANRDERVGAVRHWPLRVGMAEIGRIEVDEPDSTHLFRFVPVDELLPWLSLGLERARAISTLRAQEADLRLRSYELRLAEETLRLTLEALPFQAFLLDGDGRLLHSNRAGRAEIEQQGPAVTTALRHGLSGTPTGFVVHSLSEGDVRKRVLVLRTDGAEQLRHRLEQSTAAWALTPRQAEVLEQLLLGRANKEIAPALGCTEATVERHITDVLRKVKVDSRLSLVAKFWSHGGAPERE